MVRQPQAPLEAECEGTDVLEDCHRSSSQNSRQWPNGPSDHWSTRDDVGLSWIVEALNFSVTMGLEVGGLSPLHPKYL
jgi:hypothetical protein